MKAPNHIWMLWFKIDNIWHLNHAYYRTRKQARRDAKYWKPSKIVKYEVAKEQ